MNTSLWILRALFLSMCMLAGYAVSQTPQLGLIDHGGLGLVIGFGFGGLMIALDEMLKGFSLRAFSAATFGLVLGTVIAWLIDHSGLFDYPGEDALQTRWLIRLCLFLGFGYIGMVLAMRSNKEDFSLIIPYVRFVPRNEPQNLLLLDTSVIIDGRIAELLEQQLLEGVVIVPRFVLQELQQIGDSPDEIRRARGRHGLEVLARVRRSSRNPVKIHEADFPEESGVDGKLIRLAHSLGAKLFTNDYNLGKLAELQGVAHVNVREVASVLKPVILPGELLSLRLVREGKDKGQAVGYLNDGTMVVVNQGHDQIGQVVEVQVQSLLQTGAGVIIFAELRQGSSDTDYATRHSISNVQLR